MTGKRIVLASLLIAGNTAGPKAEEILSSQPVVIAPRRIETKAAPKAARRDDKIEQPIAEEPALTINKENIIFKVTFRKGSMQISGEMRRELKSLTVGSGRPLRLSGFGDSPPHRGGKRLANLRARAVASYLKEATGIKAKIQWTGRAYDDAETGVIVEVMEK